MLQSSIVYQMFPSFDMSGAMYVHVLVILAVHKTRFEKLKRTFCKSTRTPLV